MRVLSLALQLAIAVLIMVEGRVTKGEELPEEVRTLIQPIRLRPTVHIPRTQKHPRNLEEAKRWVKEAFYLWCEAIVAQKMGRPKLVWQAYYQEAARLAKGVFHKFGEFCVIWLVPENEWRDFGDIILYPEQIKRDYEEILKLNILPADPCIFYGDALLHKALQVAKQKGKKFIYTPEPADSSPLSTLQDSLYQLGRWKEAMEAIEHYMDSLPWFSDRLFDRWIECATKVYRKGALPTKFLLVQGLKMPQHGLGALKPSSDRGVPLLLRSKNRHHYVPLKRVALCLDWKVEQEGKEIVIKTKDREVKLRVGSKVGYVNGFKVNLPSFVEAERNDVWIPLQFVAAIAKSKLRWEKGSGFIQMELRN
ncbi:MAG: copper amine oxidase N-terminal domain-containing protein [Armatimonadota bacterium]|nr:copper amine oxidase N-terminal domain-containing protein [Armatimonadota bacterium]